VKHVSESLQRYVDDELGPEARRAVDEHCAVCPECARALAELRQFWTGVESGAAPPPARPLWPGVRARLEAQDGGTGRRGTSRRAMTWGLSGAALAAGLVLGLIFGATAPPADSPVERAGSLLPGSDETALFSAGEMTLGGLWLAAAQSEEAGS